MPNQIRNKFTDPLLHEFAPTDLFVNIEDGKLFFRSKNKLFLINAVVSGSETFIQGITGNTTNNSVALINNVGGNISVKGSGNVIYDENVFSVGNVFEPVNTIFTGRTAVLGNFTGSSNISASGNITGSHLYAKNSVSASSIEVSGDIEIVGDGNIKGVLDGDTDITNIQDIFCQNVVHAGDSAINTRIKFEENVIVLRADGTNLLVVSGASETIGIGTENPTEKLSVAGNISGSGRLFITSNQGTSENYVATFENLSTIKNTDVLKLVMGVATPNANTHFIRFDRNGGTISDTMEGDGSNGVLFTGTAAGVVSDMRNKQNIVYLKDNYNATNILKQIDVLEYEIKSDQNPIKKRHIGFNAQQLLELYPYPVTTFDKDNEGLTPEDDGFRFHKLNPGQLTPLIVKTLQEQQKIIEELKLEIDKLKNKCQE